jgi:hypothetical protein
MISAACILRVEGEVSWTEECVKVFSPAEIPRCRVWIGGPEEEVKKYGHKRSAPNKPVQPTPLRGAADLAR